MRHFMLAMAALLAASPTLAGQTAPATPQTTVSTVEQVIPAIDRLFRQYQQDAHIPGLAYMIVQDGRPVHAAAMGVQDLEQRRPVTADSRFRIASMSKLFTALAILKLRDEDKLSLDAPAANYVPELRGWNYPTSDSPPIRVRDLLNHTAGFVTDDPWGDRQQPLSEADFTAMLRAGVPFSRPPGTAMEYSNFGYALLGRIVSNVSDRLFNDYIEQEIMRPLGMVSTGYEVGEAPPERRAMGYRWENEAWALEPTMKHGVFGAMGGVQTSAADYARWVAWLLSAWPARDGTDQGPVRRSTVREIVQGSNFPVVRPLPGGAGATDCPMASAYGMGMIAAQHCELGTMLFHGGGYPGYGSFVLLLPDHNIGIFALANRTYAAPLPPVFGAALELHRAGLLDERETPVSEALAAAYRGAGAMFRVGDLTPGRNLLAMNFLMDRSEENWRREFARIEGEVGACATDAPIVATGALSGRFRWDCERGRIDGQLLLAPTNSPGIQALRLNAVPAQ